MANSGQALRRWFGVFFLAVAFALLVWGQTLLKPHLRGVGYLVYWLVCFGFTFAAIFTALLDMWATGRQTRREKKELLNDLKEFGSAEKSPSPKVKTKVRP